MVEIGKIEIDVEDLVKKAAEARRKIMEISQEMKELKDTFNKGEISIQEYSQRFTVLNSYQKEGQRELRTYDSLLAASVATEAKKQKSNERLTGSIREISAALSQNKRIYESLTEEERNNAEVGGKLLEVIQKQDKKYKELQKSMGNNQVDVGNYEKAILDALGTNNAFGGSLNSIISGLGDLRSKLSALSAPIIAFIQHGKLSAKSMDLATSATGKTSVALKVLRAAFISTGIGAILVLLGSLIAYLTSTQEGIDKVSMVLTPLKVLMETLWGVVQKLGKALVEAFTHPKEALVSLGKAIEEQIINRVTFAMEIGRGFVKLFTGDIKEGLKQMANGTLQGITGVKDTIGKTTSAVKALNNTVGEAWERGKRIAEINQKLASSEADYITKTEELKQLFAEQNQIARDTSLTLEEREKAAKRSIEINKEINKLAKERNDLEVEKIELQQQSNDTSDSERAELARKKAEALNANREMINSETAQNKVLNSIRKEGINQQKSQREEAHRRALEQIKERIATEKQAIEVYVETNSAVAKSLKERLDIEEKGKEDRLRVLEEEKQKKIINRREYEAQKRKIDEDFAKTKVDLSVNAVQQELAMYEQLNRSKLEGEAQLTAALIEEERQRQEALYQKKVKALEKEKELKEEAKQWDYAQEQEHELALLQLKQEYEAQGVELDKQQKQLRRQEEKEQQTLDFQDRLLSLQEQGATQWEIEAEQLAQKHQKERADLDQLLADKKISQERYNEQLSLMNRQHSQEDIALKRKTEEMKMSLMAGVLGQAKQLLGENTAAAKALAVAEATINTFIGVSKAISLGWPAGAIMAATTFATGMANVHKIMSTTVKYSEGGPVTGRSHAEGGVPFSVAGVGGYEMEGGEYIVNKIATAKYLPVLELINNSSRRGFNRPFHFAQGDLVRASTINTKIDVGQITEAIKEGAKLGTQQGALEGTQRGAYKGAREGAVQGTYEGSSAGTSEGVVRVLSINENNSNIKLTQGA